MVQEAYGYVDEIDNMEEKLKLIDTLRSVTDGKVCFQTYLFYLSELVLYSSILFRSMLKSREPD